MAFAQRKSGVLLNYINSAVKIITAVVYTPVMLRLLGQSEYGLYQLVSSVVSSMSLLSVGFGSAYVRFYSRCQVKDDREGIARLNGMFLLIFCVISTICLGCGAILNANAILVFGTGLAEPELATARTLLLILTVNMALTFPNSVFDCYVTAHEHFIFQKLLRIAQSILNPFLALPLLLMGHGSVAMVMVTTVLTLLVFGINIFYCVRKLHMPFSFRNLQFSLLREMWVFTFFIFLNQIIDQINWNVDKFLLGRISGTDATAVYSVGAQINSLYMEMSLAISSVFIPKVNRIVAKEDDGVELVQLMSRVGRAQVTVLTLVLLGFVFFGKSFLNLWVGEAYSQAYGVTLFLIVPITVPLIQNLGLEILRAKNKHHVRSVVCACLSVGNILISMVFIRYWGCVGAAAGTAISLLLGNVLFMNWYYHARIGLNMYYFWKEMMYFIPTLILAGILGVFCCFLFEIKTWTDLFAAIVFYTIGYFVIMWLSGLTSREKEMLKKCLPKKRYKQ